ncbi:MAG: hypothetical protein AB7J28_13790 [Hyphomonadaceae bacterium]
MDDRALQRWGVIVGGGMIAAAFAAATLTAPEVGPAETAAPAAQNREPVTLPSNNALVQPAGDAATPPPASGRIVSFIVRFEGTHPMARAQALEAQGQHAQAVRTAEQALRTRTEMQGLCFDRFTLGGAEIVLKSCEAIAANQQQTYTRQWTERLNAMPGVDYAEFNAIAQPEQN